MTPHAISPLLAAAALTTSLLTAPMLPAQDVQASGGSYTVRKQVIGTGEVSSVGSYRLTGTIAEVGAGESSTPRFRLIGGFHGPRGPADSIFCDGFEADDCDLSRTFHEDAR